MLLISAIAISCGKQDAVYKEFIKDGGFIYPAKPLNVTADRGYQRLTLHWELPMDPSIRTAKLFWDSRRESRDFDYSSYPDGKVSVVISDLEDRSYTFEIVNYDADGNSSLAAAITSSPFGESWLVSHAERTIKFLEMKGNDAVITLGKPTDEIVQTKFRYENTDGDIVVSEPFPASDGAPKLPGAAKWKYVEYQSSFCSPEGIDTVWTGNWIRSETPIATNIDASSSTITVTANQVRDSYTPSLAFDGITDNVESRWYSSNAAAYRNVWPKILVIDTKLIGDKALTFNHFKFYEDPSEDAQTSRYIRAVSIYVSDKKLSADETNYMANFGEPVLTMTLNQNSAVQDFVPAIPKAGRYVAVVFRSSYNSFGFIDLWEFEAFGYSAKVANQ